MGVRPMLFLVASQVAKVPAQPVPTRPDLSPPVPTLLVRMVLNGTRPDVPYREACLYEHRSDSGLSVSCQSRVGPFKHRRWMRLPNVATRACWKTSCPRCQTTRTLYATQPQQPLSGCLQSTNPLQRKGKAVGGRQWAVGRKQ